MTELPKDYFSSGTIWRLFQWVMNHLESFSNNLIDFSLRKYHSYNRQPGYLSIMNF